MIETNEFSTHVAGIIPVAGTPLSFNMPWHDSLIPIHDNYHAIEKAVHSAAMAGCNTIWIVLHRESQPILRKIIGEWAYDPKTVWQGMKPFWNKREVPIYYVAINPRDRKRRDSHAWSCLYGAKVASHVSKKISKWVLPKRFLVVSPYGVIDDKEFEKNRPKLRGPKNLAYIHNNKSFLDDEYLPFTFDQENYEGCKTHFREIYSGNDTLLKYSEVFKPLDINTFDCIEAPWYYKLDCWDNYSKFIGSKHNESCRRPKYLVAHEWNGLIKDR